MVLERLKQVNLKLNDSKSEYTKRELKILGHVISAEGIKPDPNKVASKRNLV